jgi:hypothetical protein
MFGSWLTGMEELTVSWKVVLTVLTFFAEDKAGAPDPAGLTGLGGANGEGDILVRCAPSSELELAGGSAELELVRPLQARNTQSTSGAERARAAVHDCGRSNADSPLADDAILRTQLTTQKERTRCNATARRVCVG